MKNKVFVIDRIIIRDAGMKIKSKNLEKVRKQIAALFNSPVDTIMFTYTETDEEIDSKKDKQFNLNTKNTF